MSVNIGTMDAVENEHKDGQDYFVFDIHFEDIRPKSGRPPAFLRIPTKIISKRSKIIRRDIPEIKSSR